MIKVEKNRILRGDKVIATKEKGVWVSDDSDIQRVCRFWGNEKVLKERLENLFKIKETMEKKGNGVKEIRKRFFLNILVGVEPFDFETFDQDGRKELRKLREEWLNQYGRLIALGWKETGETVGWISDLLQILGINLNVSPSQLYSEILKILPEINVSGEKKGLAERIITAVRFFNELNIPVPSFSWKEVEDLANHYKECGLD